MNYTRRGKDIGHKFKDWRNASEEEMQKLERELLTTDFERDDYVHIQFEHGSTYFLPDAFAMRDPEEENIWWVFAEHDPSILVFSGEDFDNKIRGTILYPEDPEERPNERYQDLKKRLEAALQK